ncbi:DUF1254 domain-containing protein [Variovorax sp. J22R115]|uniref:DUF1254 domain-containing protein n=1 Tax=Variovorax sp. J22R115 TaxID=3053509 RepID=UPI002578C883|nr:DUF1254 domain-containing protein [Variovorax sp. J22R115]MDM0047420.1 DUF1254 domain-containing protein [Variovorax sp. J22R115]
MQGLLRNIRAQGGIGPLARRLLALAALGGAAIGACAAASTAPAQNLTPAEARAIAKEAYIYGYPLVDHYRIQHAFFVERDNAEYKGPWNTIHSNARVYTPEDKAIQTPNSDTPYSYLGADLRAEPLVLTMPAVENKRYYGAQFIDAYTHNFAYVGTRATGNEAGSYLLAGPGWKGMKPAGIREVIRSETEFAFVFYRTQLSGPADIENVKKVQAGYKVQPLSAYLGRPAPTPAPVVDFIKPLTIEQERSSLQFFEVLNFVLGYAPTHPSERELMQRFAKLGIGAGLKFDAQGLSPELRQAIQDGLADAWAAQAQLEKQASAGQLGSGDLLGSREQLKNNYLYRMRGTVAGIYGNSKEEAIYQGYYTDATGQRLDGANRYVLRFKADQLPPVNAFWSLTMYRLPSRLLVANPVDRYLINSPMLPDLKRDADGGVTLYIQRESPGKDKEANWLPAPEGPFLMALRLFWPKAEIANGQWKKPELERVEPVAAAGVPVTMENFTRAESHWFFGNVARNGGFGQFRHNRTLASVDRQLVVRTNRDTLYSSAVFDLDAGPVTVTLPDAGQRFISMQSYNEDHYTPGVVYRPGEYRFTRESVGTRYVLIGIRTLVDPADPNDVAQANAVQDAIRSSQASTGRYQTPNWDAASQKKVRDALLALGETVPELKRSFGMREQVDPVRHLVASATAWGGSPEQDVIYLAVTPDRNDGNTIYQLSVKDVPVDAFWSVTVYNAKGYIEPNAQGAYTVSSVTARKAPDGTVELQFGGCEPAVANCLPLAPGWNYLVRLYRPRAQLLDGLWVFPQAQAAD